MHFPDCVYSDLDWLNEWVAEECGSIKIHARAACDGGVSLYIVCQKAQEVFKVGITKRPVRSSILSSIGQPKLDNPLQ